MKKGRSGKTTGFMRQGCRDFKPGVYENTTVGERNCSGLTGLIRGISKGVYEDDSVGEQDCLRDY